MKKLLLCSLALLLSSTAGAKVFEIFDGRVYNGLFYPKVDIIEWGEQNGELPHLEWHVHQKDKPVDIGFYVGERGGKKVIWMMYDLKYRGERVCRHTVAPSHFSEGMQLHVYRDISDKDYDNILVFSEPMPKTSRGDYPNAAAYNPPAFEPCSDENASNPPHMSAPTKAADSAPAQASASDDGSRSLNSTPAQPPAKKGLVDYDNSAVPFSF